MLTTWWAACLLWSGSFLFIRVGLADVGPFTFAAARLALAALILVPVVWTAGSARGVARRQITSIAAAGLLLLGVNYALVYWGAQHIPSGLVAILLAATPLTGLLLGAACGSEAMTPRKLGAVSCGLLGVVAIFGTEARVSGAESLRGVGVIALSTLCVAGAYVWAKHEMTGVPPLVLAAVQSTAALFPMSVLALAVEGDPFAVPWRTSSVLALLYLGVCASVVGLWLNYWLLLNMDASSMLMMGIAEVPIAIVLGYVVLGERLPAGTWLGAACLVFGLWLGPVGGGRRHE